MYQFRKIGITSPNPKTAGEKEHLLNLAILPKNALGNNGNELGKEKERTSGLLLCGTSDADLS